jgi:hypothetical protein
MTDLLRRAATYYDASYPPDVLGGGGGGPRDPHISALTPNTAVEGAGATLVTVDGSAFDADAEVEADGAALATTVVSGTQLTASYDVGAAGVVMFSVRNVATTAESNSVPFTVTAAQEAPEEGETEPPPDDAPDD